MLRLFVKTKCPYSSRALLGLVTAVHESKNAVNYEVVYINKDDKGLDELVELGGKNQVPFLFDSSNDTRMYESGDIVDYLVKKFL